MSARKTAAECTYRSGRYGHFYRAIALPESAKTEDAKARFDNGVLEITMPSEEPKSKRRQISIESATGARKRGEGLTAGSSNEAA